MNSTSHTGVAPNRDGVVNTVTGASAAPGNVLAPNTNRSANVVPKKTKLTLNLLTPKSPQPKLAAKSSHSKLSKENPARKKHPPPSAFVDKPQEKRRSRSLDVKQEKSRPVDEKPEKKSSRLGGSASKLGGLGSLVRHASKGLLKDVTNARQSSDEIFDTTRFVHVGVEDASDDGTEQTIVNIVEATPREPNFPQAVLDDQDPDISEVMVVKRSKARAPIDFQWAESAQTTTTERSRVRDNGVESDMEGGTRRPKSGWWKRRNDGTKDETRPRIPRRLSTLLSPAPKLEDLPSQDQSKSEAGDGKGSLVIRAIRSARSLNQAPAEDQTAVRDLTAKSLPPTPLPPAKPSPPEKTLRRAGRMTLSLRRSSDSKVPHETGAISSPESNTSRLAPSSFRRRPTGRLTPQPPVDPEPSVETPQEVPQVSEPPPAEPLARPFLRIRPDSRPNSRPNSRISSCPSSAVHADNRLSVVSILTNEDSQGGQSSSDTKKDRRCSTGSIVRWDPEAMSQQVKKMRIEREERMRQRAEEERERIKNGLPPPERSDKQQRILAARRRTPVMSIFDDLDLSVVDRDGERVQPHTPPPRVVVDPIIAATQAMLQQSVGSLPPKQTPEKVPRPRFGFRERINRTRPTGIVATERDGNDAAISVLNAANNDLQEILGNPDLSFTPDRSPSLPSVTPSTHNGSITSNRRVSQPLNNQRSDEAERPPLERRTSGSGVVSQQVAAWPPASPPQDSTSLSPTDLPPPPPRQRKRTTSSTVSVPPSAFNRKLSLVSDGQLEEVLPLRILRSETGNVARKTRFYGELERRTSIEREFGSRVRTNSQSRDESSQRSRTRLSSFPALETPGSVDITTDIPEELHDILVQTEPFVVSPTQIKAEPQAKMEESDESAQEFVYTGVDAIPEESTDKEYSLVNEFSSYDEVSKVDIPVREASPKPHPEDIFAPTKPPINRAPDSIISMESDASYEVILKPTAPLVLHKRKLSVDSPNQTINDTFAFASKPNPLNAPAKASGVLRNHRRSRHRRAPSLNTPGSLSSAHQSTGSHDDNFSFAVAATEELPQRPLFTSPTSEAHADKSRHLDENAPVPPSPGSYTSAGPTSVDSFFDRSHNRTSSSTSSIFTVFGIEQGKNERKGVVGKGNLFGQMTRPLSLISSYSDVGVVSDEEGVREQLELVDETEDTTPVKPKVAPKPEPSPTRIAKSTEMEKMEKMLDEEIYAAVPRPRPRNVAAPSGHFRRRTTLGLSRRPMTIAEAIQKMEMYESTLPVEDSPAQERGSSTTEAFTDASTTTNASSTSSGSLATDSSTMPIARLSSSSAVPRHVSCASWHASTSWEDFRTVTIADGGPEMDSNMVLRRYYTFQREAQEALDQSHNKWKDTAFSVDEVTTFEPPTRVDAVEHFLSESRRFYSELPVESKPRARRRAMTAPYPASINAHLEDKPGSRSGSGSSSPVDAVFRNLSMWDHRRMPKGSEKRMRKVSEEGRRSRKTSTTKIAQEKERVRKVSEKKKRANFNTDTSSVNSGVSNPPSMSGRERAAMPVIDASEEGVITDRTPRTSKTLTVNTTNLKPGSSLTTDMNGNATIGRARATVLAKVALKLQQLEQEQAQAEAKGPGQEDQEPESDDTGKENASKVNALQHSIEGVLESPTGSLRIARPRPKRKSMTTTVSPPSTIRL